MAAFHVDGCTVLPVTPYSADYIRPSLAEEEKAKIAGGNAAGYTVSTRFS